MLSPLGKYARILLLTGTALIGLLAVVLGVWIYTIDRELPTRADIVAHFDAVERSATFVDASTFPNHVAGAFVSSRDPRFYEFRPLGMDILPCCSGAAITEQVARQLPLSGQRDDGFVPDWHRKLRLFTAKMEWAAPKKRILNAYLNTAYFGKGLHGIRAAAQSYFGKAPAALDIAQAAFLAGILQAPSRYCRPDGRTRALSRRNQVIDRMIGEGFLTPVAGTAAQQVPLVAKGCFGNDAASIVR